MTAPVRIAHLRPSVIRALVVRGGAPTEARIATSAAALRSLLGGPYSFLYLHGGGDARGIVLVCAQTALQALTRKRKMPPSAAEIARILGTVAAVGPATLRDGSTAWTSLTDSEVEFWRVALDSTVGKRGPR